MLDRLTSHARGAFRSLLTVGVLLQLGATGCRDSAPDDLIQQEQTTDALVFVKTDGEETLNRPWASGNLLKLSPIRPAGAETRITDFTGAAICDPAGSF